jgi:hypothetical protein
MLSKINWELLGALTAAFICATMLFAMPKQEGKLYDCGLAEISPDYPVQENPALPSIRSLPRGSGGMWSRCRRMRGSSSN